MKQGAIIIPTITNEEKIENLRSDLESPQEITGGSFELILQMLAEEFAEVDLKLRQDAPEQATLPKINAKNRVQFNLNGQNRIELNGESNNEGRSQEKLTHAATDIDVLPIHNGGGGHWVLLIADYEQKLITCFDPKGNFAATTGLLDSDKKKFDEEKLKQNFFSNPDLVKNFKVLNPCQSELSIDGEEIGNQVQQGNDNKNCGIWCAKFAEKYLEAIKSKQQEAPGMNINFEDLVNQMVSELGANQKNGQENNSETIRKNFLERFYRRRNSQQQANKDSFSDLSESSRPASPSNVSLSFDNKSEKSQLMEAVAIADALPKELSSGRKSSIIVQKATPGRPPQTPRREYNMQPQTPLLQTPPQTPIQTPRSVGSFAATVLNTIRAVVTPRKIAQVETPANTEQQTPRSFLRRALEAPTPRSRSGFRTGKMEVPNTVIKTGSGPSRFRLPISSRRDDSNMPKTLFSARISSPAEVTTPNLAEGSFNKTGSVRGLINFFTSQGKAPPANDLNGRPTGDNSEVRKKTSLFSSVVAAISPRLSRGVSGKIDKKDKDRFASETPEFSKFPVAELWPSPFSPNVSANSRKETRNSLEASAVDAKQSNLFPINSSAADRRELPIVSNLESDRAVTVDEEKQKRRNSLSASAFSSLGSSEFVSPRTEEAHSVELSKTGSIFPSARDSNITTASSPPSSREIKKEHQTTLSKRVNEDEAGEGVSIAKSLPEANRLPSSDKIKNSYNKNQNLFFGTLKANASNAKGGANDPDFLIKKALSNLKERIVDEYKVTDLADRIIDNLFGISNYDGNGNFYAKEKFEDLAFNDSKLTQSYEMKELMNALEEKVNQINHGAKSSRDRRNDTATKQKFENHLLFVFADFKLKGFGGSEDESEKDRALKILKSLSKANQQTGYPSAAASDTLEYWKKALQTNKNKAVEQRPSTSTRAISASILDIQRKKMK